MERKHKFYLTILASGAALFGTVLSVRGVHDSFIFNRVTADSNYHLTLDSNNRYTGGSTKEITTSSGNATVSFAYADCASASGYHVKLNSDGSIKNTQQITSVESIYPVFTASSGVSLQFRASYDAETWGEYATLTSGKNFDLASKPYFFEIKAVGGSVNLTSLRFDYSCFPNQDAEQQQGGTKEFVKVASALDDYSGTYLIVCDSKNLAFDASLDTLDAEGNVTSVTISDGVISYTEALEAKTVEIAALTNGYSIKTSSGYYIGNDSGKNALSSSKTVVYTNSIDFVTGGTPYVEISGKGGKVLAFNNSSSGGNRFRYITSIGGDMLPIQLYKLSNGSTPIGIPEYEARLQITDENADSRVFGQSFSKVFETEYFSASVLMSDGNEKAVAISDLTIDIEKNGVHYGVNDPLNVEGTYNVTISYGTTLAPFTYQITVSKIAVSSVSFDETSLRLKPAEDYTLTATVLPVDAYEKSLTWTSTDNSVATVTSDGKVTAVSDGTATIKATANNGVYASCEVTVSSQASHSGTSADDPFTVSEALAYYNAGGKVTTGAVYITGVVTSSPSDPTVYSGRGRLYITDGSQTLYIYNINGLTNTNNVTSNLIKVGNTLVVTGAIKDYQGTPQLAYVNGVVNCYIISSTEQVIPVTGITISPTNTDVSVNNTVTLTATIAPSNASNKGVVWSSSNSNVASVDQNGVVTGHIVEQSATIYAKSAEDNSISASCTVNVKAIAVQSVSLDQETATVAIGEELTLIHTISPATASNTNVTWSSNNESVATVSNGVVSALAEGEATITVKTDDGNYTASCVVTVTEKAATKEWVLVEGTSGLKSGNKYVIACNTKGTTAGDISSQIMASVSSVFSSDKSKITTLGTGTVELTLGGSTGNWTFANSDGDLLGATAVKKLAWGSGTTTWTITFSGNDCNFTNNTSSYGSMSYNSGSPRFTTYSATQTAIQLYTLSGGGTPEPTLESIKVDTSSHRTFTVGDTFVKETIKAVYSDGNEVDVTNDATFSGYNMSTAGTQTVSVSYSGKSTSYQITVNAKVATLSSITVSEDHRIFSVGDTFVKETVTAHYSDGSSKTVTATFTGIPNMSAAGTFTINVSYTEGGVTKDTSYTITVKSSGSGGGTSGTHTILASDAPTAYGTDTEKTVDDITYVFNQVGNSYTAGYMQCKKSVSYIYNKTAINGLMSISINTSSKSWGGSVYYGTSEEPLVNKATLSNGKYSIPSGNSYFNIVTNSSTGYIESIDIEYSTTPVNPTAISISGDTELTPGSTGQLSLSFSPANCNVKDVTWSSNSTSITVDQTGKVTVASTAKVGSTATITATSNEVGTVKGTITITVVDEPVTPKDKWTMLVYMCGADLESDYASDNDGCATDDLKEMYSKKSGMNDDVNIVVQAGGAKSWSSEYSSVINKDKRNRFHLTKNGYVLDSQVTKVNMGDEASLEDFVEWGLKTYPAEKVGLVLWNHGGAMGGCCYDEQFSNDKLTPAEVASAIPTAISKSGYNQNLEFIGYDCCLMSIQDIAGLNANYANYMVASQESEWGYGWSYDSFVDKIMSNKSTTTILQACVDGFAADTASAYADWGDPNDQTLAYYNLQNWSAYETAWENFAGYLNSNVIKSSSNWSTFAKVVNQAQKYGYDSDTKYNQYNGGYCYDIFDVKDFLNKIKASNDYKNNSSLMSYVSAIESAYAGLGIYSKCGSAAGNSNGLCFFCPLSGYNETDGEYAEANTTFTKWRSLCVTYGKWY